MKAINSILILMFVFFMTGCPSNGKTNGESDNEPLPEPFITGGTLIWYDEFDGDSLDLTKWNIDTGTGAQFNLNGWGNDERQFYSPDNVVVKDGILYLEARKEDKGGRNYTSGKITSGGNLSHDRSTTGELKFAVKPGMRIEARIKSTRGAGFWPAFWLLGTTSNEYSGYQPLGWPRCGEIDIFEMRGGQERQLLSTIHYGTVWPNNRHRGQTKNLNFSMADTWNVYGVTWDVNTMYFLLNGEIWQTINLRALHNSNRNENVQEAFGAQTGFFININLAIGGNFISGTVPSDSVFSENAPYEDRCFMVDWVRVYQPD